MQQGKPDPRTFDAPTITLHQQPAALPEAVIARPAAAPEKTTPQPVGRYVEVTLSPQANGNFVAPGTINGRSVMFLIDTGATFVTVPEKLQGSLGLSRGPNFRSKTANGVVSHYGTRIERMSLGRLELSEVPGALNPHAPDDTVLLGMSALRGLELIHTNGQLILRQPVANSTQVAAAPVPRLGIPQFKRPLAACMARDKLVDARVLACMEGR